MTLDSPRAVLWDMDGTLVDTEPFWIAAERPLIESYGGTWTEEDALQLVGLALENSAAVLQSAGVALTVPEIIDRLTDDVLSGLRRDGVPFRPGAKELLRSLREAGIRTALVTMSMRRMATEMVSLIDFDAFDVIVAGDDVSRPKPHPDPYLQACAELGVDPADTVALEDSPTGLRSATAAGTVAIGIPNMVGLDELGAAELWPTLAGRDADDVRRSWRTRAAVGG